MYQNDFSIKEVNAYYARQGGIRTAKIHGYANAGSFSSLMQRAVAQAGRAAQTAATEESRATAQSGSAAQLLPTAGGHAAAAQSAASSAAQNAAGLALPTRQSRHTADSHPTAGGTAGAERSAAQNSTAAQAAQSSPETAAQPASGSGNVCCEQCHATNQLMLQMMSRNLYAQSALNYPLSGYGSWTAYQNMANLLGNSLF